MARKVKLLNLPAYFSAGTNFCQFKISLFSVSNAPSTRKKVNNRTVKFNSIHKHME